MYPFQENAVRRFLANGALLLAHDVGMGKTRTALESLYRLTTTIAGPSALIVTPANLRLNFLDNAKRFTPELDIGIVTKIAEFSSAAIPIVSYDFLRANIEFLASRRFDAVVCDEFHHGKNQATLNHACLSRLRGRADRFLCLTGSPLQNSVNEFWTLLDLVAGTPVSPGLDACLERMWDFRKASFWRRFYQCVIRKRPVVGPLKAIAHPREFRRLIGSWVDFQRPGASPSGAGMPRLAEETLSVKLSESEWRAYLYAMKKVREKDLATAIDGTMPERDLRKVISSVAMARQALLSPDAIHSTIDVPTPSAKLEALADQLKEKYLPALVFSNFHEFGASVIHALLERRGFNAALIHGGTPGRERTRVKKAFDAGRLDALVLSPVGGEGLSFPGARSVHIADPHWNPEVSRQMIGRALRLDSRVEEVFAFRYQAIGPQGEKTIDEAIRRVAAGKERFNHAIRAAIFDDQDSDEPIPFARRAKDGDGDP